MTTKDRKKQCRTEEEIRNMYTYKDTEEDKPKHPPKKFLDSLR